MVQIDSEWPILAVLQLFQYFLTKLVQIFQYFLTKVVQVDSEWSILAVLQLSQYFLHIAYTYVALLYLHRQREQCHCNLFSEIYEQLLFTFHLNFMCLLPLRLSSVFLAKMLNELGSIRTYFFPSLKIPNFVGQISQRLQAICHCDLP